MAAIVVVGVFGQSTLINSHVMRDFQRVEDSQVHASLRLIQLLLDRFLVPTEALAREVSQWPELDSLTVGGGGRRLRQRLVSVREVESGYDVVVITDRKGRVLFQVGFDRDSHEERGPDPNLIQYLKRHDEALGRFGQRDLAGWMAVPGGLFASAGRRASLSDGSDVTILVGRLLDGGELAALDDLSGTNITTVTGDPPKAVDATQPQQACTRLSPLLNASPEHLCVRLQDSFLERGLRSSQDLRLASLAGFILLMLGTWLFIDRSLMQRLAALTRNLSASTLPGAGTETLEKAMLSDGKRGDELGTMSAGLGRLLGRVRQAEVELREREHSFRTLAESSSVAIFVLRDGILYTNPFAWRLTGYEPGELRGRTLDSLAHEESRAKIRTWLQNTNLDSADGGHGREMRGVRKDGTHYWAQLQAARIEYQGAPALLATLFDISEQRHLEQVLAEEKQNLQVILSSIHDGIVAVDGAGIVRFLNPAAQRLTGIPSALADGSPLEDVLYLTEPETGKPLRVPLVRTLVTSTMLANVTTPQGHSCSVELSVSHRQSEPRDGSAGTVLVLRDVSDLRRLTQTLSQQATHDDLTSLINRREFSRRLQEALDNTRRSGRPYALCYLDLDQFKLLNDTCGHHAGDLMLREIADVLRARVRTGDTLARLGGDEFGVLLDDCPPERSILIANVLRTVISSVRFQWNGQNFSVDASIGIAMLEHVEGNVDEALALADAACYMAKDLGRNRVHLYCPTDSGLQQQLRDMRWATRLKEAVEQSHFCLYAQGIWPVARSAPAIGACEALVRMRTPDGKIITPEEFLAAAERYQMMTHIDRWVVNAALNALEREARLGRAQRPKLFVNLSGQSLGDEGFHEFILHKLSQHSGLASQLVFEVTETAVISSLARAKQFMDDVYALGCAFALDDFGTGMSSFSYLKEMRVDYLKIAGCFVKNANQALDNAVCRSFTDFARMLKLTTIAEWVEDDRILGALREMGVDYGQGVHFGRPMPIEKVLGLE